MGRPGTPAAKRAAVAKRRADAIDLRLSGLDLVAIGRQLKYGKWTDDDPPVQVTSDATLAAEVSKDISRALADRRSRMDEAAADLVQLHDVRIERLLTGVWDKATSGSPAHVREARALLERQARMHGIDRPVRHEVSIPEAEAAVIAAVADLVELVEGRDVDKPAVRAVGGG